MDVWQERDRFRQRNKKAYKRHTQKLRDTLSKAKQQMTFEAEYIQKCSECFDELQEDFRKIYVEEKAINQLLGLLPKGSGSIEINDIQREADKLQMQFTQALQLLQDFVLCVRQDCVMDKNYFNFFYIPDLIVRKKYQRKEYELILKILKKVKVAYIEAKTEKELYRKLQEEFGKMRHDDDDDYVVNKNDSVDEKDDDKITEVQVTDEDLVPLELFDGVLAEFQHKFQSKRTIQLDFLKQCKEEQQKKLKLLGVESGKQKQEIEKTSFANYLNTRLEQNHSQLFTLQFKHNLLFYALTGKEKPTNSKDFHKKFFQCIDADQQGTRYFLEWREKLNKEMNVFNGKIAGDDGTTSNTSASTAIL